MTLPAVLPFEHRVESRSDGRSLAAWVCRAGQDVVISVGGGTSPHIGAVVLAQPHPSSSGLDGAAPSASILTIPPHKEEPVARPIAEAVCRATGAVTVVTAGVHEDAIDREGIETYLRLARQMAAELAAMLGTADPEATS